MKELTKEMLEQAHRETQRQNAAEQTDRSGVRYVFNSSGVLEKEEPYNGPDILVVGGNKPLELTSGTKIYKENAEEHGISGLRIEGNIDSVFKYMAKNTNVEWGMSYEGSGKKLSGVMRTDYLRDKVEFLPISGYGHYVHTHPEGTGIPSKDDKDVEVQYDRKKGNKGGDYDYYSFEMYFTNDKGEIEWDTQENLEAKYGQYE